MTWPELRGTDKSQEIQSHHNRKYPKFSDIFPSFSDFRFWLICNHFTSVFFLILIFFFKKLYRSKAADQELNRKYVLIVFVNCQHSRSWYQVINLGLIISKSALFSNFWRSFSLTIFYTQLRGWSTRLMYR